MSSKYISKVLLRLVPKSTQSSVFAHAKEGTILSSSISGGEADGDAQSLKLAVLLSGRSSENIRCALARAVSTVHGSMVKLDNDGTKADAETDGDGEELPRTVRVSVAMETPEGVTPDPIVEGHALGEAAGLALLQVAPGRLASEPLTTQLELLEARLAQVSLEPDGTHDESSFEAGLWHARADGITRLLANAPANVATPSAIVSFARTVLGGVAADASIVGRSAVEDAGLHLLAGVGAGSAEEPSLLDMTLPNCVPKPTTLIGKGITFDSGGISIKPSANMGAMKMDMGGAAAVLGVAAALSERVNHNEHDLRIICPLAENMPSGTAIKPGDVLQSAKGDTVEIDNTDAEGRLVLADAITRANLQPGARAVSVATLTGACVVAIGRATGVFARRRASADAYCAAAATAGEPAWHLPMSDEWHKSALKSTVADLVNCTSDGRGAGASTAATFLDHFVGEGDVDYLHLDVAGSAMAHATDARLRPYIPSTGATGSPTRSLLHFVTADQWE